MEIEKIDILGNDGKRHLIEHEKYDSFKRNNFIKEENGEEVLNAFEKQENNLLKNKQKDFNPISLDELFNYNNEDSTEWVIEGILQPKKIGLIAGSSGTLKSWMVLNISFSVALGLPFVNTFPTKQGSVLFIDRENAIPELKKRCQLIYNGLKLEDSKIPIYFLSEQSIKLDEESGITKLKLYIKKKNISLIIVDTYRRAISYEENDAGAVSTFFVDIIKPICEEADVSFIFIHHHKKGKSEGNEIDLIRGSSDFANYVDCVLQVSRNGEIMRIKQSKNRGAKELQPFNLRVETDEDNYFRFVYDGAYKPLDKSHKGAEVILLWIAKNKIVEFKTGQAQEIAEAEGIKKTNFHTALQELVNRGEIKKEEHGLYSVLVQKKLNSSESSIEQNEQLNNSKFKSSIPYGAEQFEQNTPKSAIQQLCFICGSPDANLTQDGQIYYCVECGQRKFY